MHILISETSIRRVSNIVIYETLLGMYKLPIYFFSVNTFLSRKSRPIFESVLVQKTHLLVVNVEAVVFCRVKSPILSKL